MVDPIVKKNITPGLILLVAGSGALVLSACHLLQSGTCAFIEQKFQLAQSVAAGVALKVMDGAEVKSDLVATVDPSGHVWLSDHGPAPTFFQTRSYAVTITDGGKISFEQRFEIISPYSAYLASAGALAFFLALPFLLLCRVEKPWHSLVSEGTNGLSLSRVQLAIWLLAGVMFYSALSIPMHQFAPLTATFAVLMGLSGATTLLGTASTPSIDPVTAAQQKLQAAALSGPAAVAQAQSMLKDARSPPRLADLITGFDGQPDVSRYQLLLLTLIGFVILSVAFYSNLAVPDIPQQFLGLMGVSQATYVGTKAVKASAGS